MAETIEDAIAEDEDQVTDDDLLEEDEDGEEETEVKELVKVDSSDLDFIGSGGNLVLPKFSDDMSIEQRSETARQGALAAVSLQAQNGVLTGHYLYEVFENEYWRSWTFEDETGERRNFKNFNEYCDSELDMKSRNARYLVEVYKKYVVDLGLPSDVLKDINWTKALALKDVIDEENWQDLFEQTEEMSVAKTKQFVKDIKAGGSADDDDAEGSTGTRAESEAGEKHRVSFSLTDDQFESYEAALEIAKGLTNSDVLATNMDAIFVEFTTGAIGTDLNAKMASLESALQNLQRVYDVKLKIVEV